MKKVSLWPSKNKDPKERADFGEKGKRMALLIGRKQGL